jgi:flagellar protein FlgJ
MKVSLPPAAANTPPANTTQKLPASAPIDAKTLAERKKAEKVAEEFESIFLDMMLKSMRKTAVGEEQSNAQSIYTSMLDSEYAKNMSANKSFGIKSLILDWLEKHNHTKPADGNSTSVDPTNLSNPSIEAVRKTELQNLEKFPPAAAGRLDLETLKSKMATDIYTMQSRMLGK